jgi:predicted homoserine dehydrogenase-like protein
LRIVLNVIWAQKTGRRVDVAANQHGRVEIMDNVFVVLGQGLISERRVHNSKDEDKSETAKRSNMLIHMLVAYVDIRDSAISTIWRLIE